jgi:hypothetical protein
VSKDSHILRDPLRIRLLGLINCHLALGNLDNLGLDRITSDQSIDLNWVGLANLSRSTNGHEVIGAVEVNVKDDNASRGLDVDAILCLFCGKKEDKV